MEDKPKKTLDELDVQLNVTRDYLKLRKELIGEDIPDELKKDGRSNNNEEDTLDGFSQSELKTNLEQKVAICENIEKLMDDDIIYAYHKKLPEYRRQFLSIGPVAPNLQEDIQYRFESGSRQIEEKYNNFLLDGMDVTKKKKEYFAFISYKSEDVEWATWLQHELEHYHLPASFNGRKDVPQELRPVFRDIDELSAGNLPDQIKKALVNSQNLIVICSPQAAQSPWVNQEVETFISLGKTERIFPFIVEGNSPSEFFPPALLNLSKDEERLGGDVSKKGRDAAFVKVVAGMLGIDFDSLWNRYEKEKAEEERKQREQRDNLFRVQSRFLAEKVLKLVESGDSYTARLLALEALPQTMDVPNRPYVVEAEIALRKAYQNDNILLEGHTGSISSVAISPDGNIIASASHDNFIRLWDIQTGRCLSMFEKPSIRIGKFKFEVLDGQVDEINCLGFNSVSFSPDGKYVVAAGRDSAIYVWDISTNECVAKIYNYDIRCPVNVAKFSPDGKLIISGGEYLNNQDACIHSLSFWESRKGRHLFSRDTKEPVYDISFSHDGKRLATIGDNYIHIWDTESYELLTCFEYRTNRQNSEDPKRILFSPKGDIIAISSYDTIQIWELETRKMIQSFGIQDSEIKSIAFSLDGAFIYSGGKDCKIYMWDIQNGKNLNVLNSHSGAINNIIVSPDGKYLVSGSDDHIIKLLDTNPDKALISFKLPSDLSKTGNVSYSISDDYKITINSKGNDKETEAVYETDGNSIIIKNKKHDLYYSVNNPHLGEVQYALFSPNEKNLLTLSYDKDICICCNLPQTEQELEMHEEYTLYLKGHTAIVRWASFSPEGKYIVSASEDMTIRIWDLATCNCIQTINSYDDSIDHVEFTPNGKYIVATGYHKNGKVWAFHSLQELIDNTNSMFQTRQLTFEERKKYYLN